jgi:ribosomal protein S12 methylthiotransferase
MVSAGVGFADDPEFADVQFINTCAFIPPARDEAEEVIQDAVEWKKCKRSRKIIVGGCLTQWDTKGVFKKRYPEIDLWLPVDEARNLHSHVKSLFKKSGKALSAGAVETPTWLQEESTPRMQLTSPHFAYLKIADGCDNHCSYCAIPAIRGVLRNRSLPSIVKEAGNLVRNGVKELIVTAQDTTAYYDPDTGANLAELLKALDLIEGDFGVRLLYAHPASIDDELIELFGALKHLLRYIDMPIQHISDSILKSMNRNVTSAEIRAKIAKLRKVAPGMIIRTTLLLGFPGETEDDFRKIRDFVKEMRFDRLGVFTYFCEETAPAANLTNDVPVELAESRCDEIMQLQAGISLELNEKLVGENLEVVVDDIDDDGAIARSYMDAPDIDNIVIVENCVDCEIGDTLKVRITSAEEYQLYATL